MRRARNASPPVPGKPRADDPTGLALKTQREVVHDDHSTRYRRFGEHIATLARRASAARGDSSLPWPGVTPELS